MGNRFLMSFRRLIFEAAFEEEGRNRYDLRREQVPADGTGK